MITIKEFIDKHKITMHWAFHNPFHPVKFVSSKLIDHPHGLYVLHVLLCKPDGKSMGLDMVLPKENPIIEKVFSTFAIDARILEKGGYEEFCKVYELEPDLKLAIANFQLINNITKQLKNFLGENGYEQLVNNTIKN